MGLPGQASRRRCSPQPAHPRGIQALRQGIKASVCGLSDCTTSDPTLATPSPGPPMIFQSRRENELWRQGPALPPASRAERGQPAWSFRPVPPHPRTPRPVPTFPTARRCKGQKTEDSLEDEPVSSTLTSQPVSPQTRTLAQASRDSGPRSAPRPLVSPTLVGKEGAARAPPAAKAVPAVGLRDLT